jgi:hypothetical protein
LRFHRGGFVFIAAALCSCLDFDKFDVSNAPAPGPTIVTPPAELRLRAFLDPPKELRVPRGGSRKFTIRVDRAGDINPITLKVENLPAKVTAAPVTIEPSGNEATIEVVASADAAPAKTDNVEIRAQQLVHPIPLIVTRAGLDPTFGSGGIATAATDGAFEDLQIDAEGRPQIVVSLANPDRFRILRATTAGQFASVTEKPISANRTPLRLGLGANEATVVAAEHISSLQFLIKPPLGEWNTKFTSASPGAKPHLARALIVGSGANMRVVAAASGRMTLRTGPNQGLPRQAFSISSIHMDGAPDTTFGESQGLTALETGDDEEASELLAGKYGYLVCGNTSAGMILARFTVPFGQIDNVFGKNGVARPTNEATCRTMTFDDASQEKFLVAGNMAIDGAAKRAFVARFDAFGQIDRTFGDQGFVTLNADNATALGMDQHFIVGQLADGSAYVFQIDDPLFGPDVGGSFTVMTNAQARVVKVDPLDSKRLLVGGRTSSDGWFVARILLP